MNRLLAITVLLASTAAAQCVPGNVAGCKTAQAGPSGVIAGSVPSVSVAYNVVFSTGNANRVQDIYYLTSEGLTGPHRQCSMGGPIFPPHPGGGNSGDKGTFAFEGYSDYVLLVEQSLCPVYPGNYTLNVAAGAHAIAGWQDMMCQRRSIANHIRAGTWPGTIDAGFVDFTFSWGSMMALKTGNLTLPGYTESCEYSDTFRVRSFAGQAVVWSLKDLCDGTAGGCFSNNGGTQLFAAIADEFNCNLGGGTTMDACAAGTTSTNGFGWIVGAPITYVGSLPSRLYAGNGATDSLLIPQFNTNLAIAAYANAGLALDTMLTTEGGGGHQSGLFEQMGCPNSECTATNGSGQTWTKLFLRSQNTAPVSGAGTGIGF